MTQEKNQSAQEKIAQAFAEIQEEQRTKREFKEQQISFVKKEPLLAVQSFIKVKNGSPVGLLEEQHEFYKHLPVSEMAAYIEQERQNNLDIIEITKNERFIHEKASKSYDEARIKVTECVEAIKQLDNFRAEIQVTNWLGETFVDKPAGKARITKINSKDTEEVWKKWLA